ncbi:MAG: hypothetical protein V7752_02755 [Halopseudomonas sp.]
MPNLSASGWVLWRPTGDTGLTKGIVCGTTQLLIDSGELSNQDPSKQYEILAKQVCLHTVNTTSIQHSNCQQFMRETIDNLRRELETTIRVLHALKRFRLFASRQSDVDRINRNPDFWIIYEVSVRTNLFIGLRRLYEGKNGTFNFQRFIAICINNISDFSADRLRQRKMVGSYKANEWIESYLENIYEPTVDDFKSLSKIVRNNSKRMKGIYTDAASRIYAHAIHMDRTSIAEITDQLDFDEMEIALDSMWHCYEQIWQMYENGRSPIFDISEYPNKQEVYDCLDTQLG